MTSKTVCNVRPTAPLVLVALSLGLACGTARAASFGVQVVDDTGRAVAGASVCIGLPGNYSQFGALFTDADGRAGTDVPNVPLVVTVSKTRFAAVRISEPARAFDLVKQVVLDAGAIPGPRCRAGSSLAQPGVGLGIDRVDVDRRGERIRLSASVSGAPTHYRLFASEDFPAGEWRPYEPIMTLPDTLSGASEVYLQLRRYEGGERGWLEALSAVRPVRLHGGGLL